MSDAARSIFGSLDWARVQQLISAQEPENLHLDSISAAGFKKDQNFNWQNISKPLGIVTRQLRL